MEGTDPPAVVVGGIIGWRFWATCLWQRELRSVIFCDQVWLPGLPVRGDPEAEPTMPYGRPGVHAFVDKETALREWNHGMGSLAGGSVYLYGLVLMYELGYRASYAVVKDIDYVGRHAGNYLTAAQWTEIYNVNQQE